MTQRCQNLSILQRFFMFYSISVQKIIHSSLSSPKLLHLLGLMKATQGGSIQLIFTKLINLVSLQQFHHKPTGMQKSFFFQKMIIPWNVDPPSTQYVHEFVLTKGTSHRQNYWWTLKQNEMHLLLQVILYNIKINFKSQE